MYRFGTETRKECEKMKKVDRSEADSGHKREKN